MTPPRHAVLLLFLTTLLLPVGHAAAMVEVAPPTTARAVAPGYRLFGTLNRASPVFEPGEPMVFTLTLMNGDRPVVGDTLKWTRSGDDGVTESGVAELTDAGVQVVASTDTPGFVRIYATVERGGEPLRSATEGNEAGKPLFFDGGACVAPEALHPVDEPEDFDAFWASQKELLATVPMKVLEMNELEGDDRVRAWDVKIACAGGAPVSGYLVMPRDAGPGSLEAEVSFQGYGVKSAYPMTTPLPSPSAPADRSRLARIRNRFLVVVALLLSAGHAAAAPPNVLFLSVDDLKPELGCYGSAHVKTPNIDRLAERGVLFERHYVQQAVCGPSRASMFTGLRPDSTGVWDLKHTVREENPNAFTMQQHFKDHGYATAGAGKAEAE